MARMHSRKRGRSASKRPHAHVDLSWVPLSSEEIEELVVKLAKKGHKPSEIGMILRDEYGVPLIKRVIGEKVTRILEKHGLKPEIPEDLENLIKRAYRVRKHLEFHRKDLVAKRGLGLIEAKIHRLVKYYKRTGKLPKNWKYTPEIAELYAA